MNLLLFFPSLLLAGMSEKIHFLNCHLSHCWHYHHEEVLCHGHWSPSEPHQHQKRHAYPTCQQLRIEPLNSGQFSARGCCEFSKWGTLASSTLSVFCKRTGRAPRVNKPGGHPSLYRHKQVFLILKECRILSAPPCLCLGDVSIPVCSPLHSLCSTTAAPGRTPLCSLLVFSVALY